MICWASETFSGFSKAQCTAFKRGVHKWLSAVRYVQDRKERNKEVWCHALGEWIEAKNVVAAHLVPASLEGEEISYVFGVERLSLTNSLLGKFWKYNKKK